MAAPYFELVDAWLQIEEAVALPHALETIEAAFATRITGTATLGSNVVRNRAQGRPWPTTITAGASVSTVADELVRRAKTGNTILEHRRATLELEIVCRDKTAPADVAKLVMSEVTTALLVDATLAVNARTVVHANTAIDTDGDKTAQETTTAVMAWDVEYQIEAQDPDTILPL